MIGVALALIVVGVTFVFVIPWVGVPVGIIGVVLLIAFLAGFGRRAAQFGTLRAVERRDDDADRPPVWVVEDIDHTIQWMVCPRSHRRRTRLVTPRPPVSGGPGRRRTSQTSCARTLKQEEHTLKEIDEKARRLTLQTVRAGAQ
jgi:hypothetical protein